MKRYLLILVQLLIVLSGFSQNVVKYSKGNLNLRENSNTFSQVITVIPKGTSVTMEENCNCEWIRVSYRGQTGYVYSKYLSAKQPTVSTHVGHSKVKHYTNSAGERVQSPTYYRSAPAGATAICGDGTYSFSRSRRGTCSHHGGVQVWL
jgi:uncharacterized protein YgiM (DUF1202 family)